MAKTMKMVLKILTIQKMAKKDKIVLVGGGGHALSLLEALRDPKAVRGYIALEASPSLTLEWLGDDEAARGLRDDSLFHIAFVYSGLPVMALRRKIIEKYETMGARFASIIAPTAIVTRNARIADGCAVMNGAIVNRAHIGRHAVVNTGAIVEHDCEIGSNTFIGPGAVMGGAVKIGSDCFIGLGSRIKNGVTIAPGITVGMGAVVTDDLREPGIYHGNPLKFHSLKKIKK